MDRKITPASLFSLLMLGALVASGLTGCGGSEESDEAALMETAESGVEASSAGTSTESPADSPSLPELQPTPRWEMERLTAPRYVPARPDETVVARTSMGDLTIKDLIDVYTHWQLPVQPPTAPEKIPEMPDRWLDGLAREVAMARAAEREADLVSAPQLISKYFQANQELRVLIAL